MNLADFVALSDADQLQELTKNGVRLGNRCDDEFKITLYQVDGFYIEVYYHKVKKHISHLGAFSTTDLLEPYLGDIDITHLLFNKD